MLKFSRPQGPLCRRLARPLVPALLALTLGTAAQAAPAAATPPTAQSNLNGELFFQLLLGELSVQNDDPGNGFALLLDAARKTGDERLYQRAMEIALRARSGESALQAARAWKQAYPQSREANRYVLQILINLNRLGDITEPLQRDIALSPADERNTTIALIPRQFVPSNDRALALAAVEQALSSYLNQRATRVSAWSTLGHMRLAAGDATGALEAAKRALALDDKAEAPAFLALVLMGSQQKAAEDLLRQHFAANPKSEVRLGYVRALLESQRFAEAASHIQLITQNHPEQADIWLIKGALELQENDLKAAQTSLLRYLALAEPTANSNAEEQSRGLVQAYLSLAHIAEQNRDPAQAERWLSKIKRNEDMVRSQSLRAQILARQGKLEEGRKLIQQLPARTPEEARLKLVAEVQLLRDNQQAAQAYALLQDATARNPQDHELLYDQAVLAEKLGDTDAMEQLLRRIMVLKPDYHHAYNALGYSYAERNIRLEEARQLIRKALEFAPADPFILDSLAWVEFRSGHLPLALQILQGAYKARPDPEIAAHLGEVLWTLGQHAQALQIWREAHTLAPDNDTLNATLQRLQVKP